MYVAARNVPMAYYTMIKFLFNVLRINFHNDLIRVSKRTNNSLNDKYGLNHMSTIFILWQMSPSKHPILLCKKHGR